MKLKIHAFAGLIGFLTILTFWTSTVISELFLSHEAIATIKSLILYGMFLLLPAMVIAGASGMSLGGKREDVTAKAKKKRMPFVAANGLLILVPAAFFLESRAAAGVYDGWFYLVQALELIAGATNLTLMGFNIRDGLTMTGRIAPRSGSHLRAATLNTMIEERDGGPIVVKGLTEFQMHDGQIQSCKPVLALCRCGASKNKPYCDGSHSEIGFDSKVQSERTKDKLRKYTGKEIAVHYNRLLCSHAGECGKLGSVFDPSKKSWIDPDQGSVKDIIEIVAACPSGALSYSVDKTPPQHRVENAPGLVVEKNGPFRIVKIPLASERLGAGACAEKYTLCRCGASKNKPYCDGSHHDIKWKG